MLVLAVGVSARDEVVAVGFRGGGVGCIKHAAKEALVVGGVAKDEVANIGDAEGVLEHLLHVAPLLGLAVFGLLQTVHFLNL